MATDAVAFGRAFVAHLFLVARIRQGAQLRRAYCILLHIRAKQLCGLLDLHEIRARTFTLVDPDAELLAADLV